MTQIELPFQPPMHYTEEELESATRFVNRLKQGVAFHQAEKLQPGSQEKPAPD